MLLKVFLQIRILGMDNTVSALMCQGMETAPKIKDFHCTLRSKQISKTLEKILGKETYRCKFHLAGSSIKPSHIQVKRSFAK